MTFITKLAKVRTINQEGETRFLGFKLQMDEDWFRIEQAYGQAPEEKIFWEVFTHFVREYFLLNPGTESDFLVGAPYRFKCRYGTTGCQDWAIEIAHDRNYPTVHRNVFHVSMYGKINEGVSTNPSFLIALAKWQGIDVTSVDKKFTLGEGDEEELVEFFFENPRNIRSEEGWVFEEEEIKISNFFEKGVEEGEQPSKAPSDNEPLSEKEYWDDLFSEQ